MATKATTPTNTTCTRCGAKATHVATLLAPNGVHGQWRRCAACCQRIATYGGDWVTVRRAR